MGGVSDISFSALNNAMLFDIRPKEKRSDLFNYEKEYAQLMAGARDRNTPVIAITGLRRTGKTSLLKICFNEMRGRKAYLDARMLGNSDKEVAESIIAALAKDDIFAKIIGRVGAVSLAGATLSLSASSHRLIDILAKIDKEGGMVIFIDEAQLLKRTQFDSVVAYCYDNLRGIKFVLSGSEIGVLDGFLGRDDETAPLFGRAVETVHLAPLPSEKSVLFLKEGMREAGKKCSEEDIAFAVSMLDGIAGWLAMFGWHVSKGVQPKKAVDTVFAEGSRLIRKEVEGFLAARAGAKGRYMRILSFVAKEPAVWNEIKTHLERKENGKINDKQLAKYLQALCDYGFMVKKDERYSVPDPVFRHFLA